MAAVKRAFFSLIGGLAVFASTDSDGAESTSLDTLAMFFEGRLSLAPPECMIEAEVVTEGLAWTQAQINSELERQERMMVAQDAGLTSEQRESIRQFRLSLIRAAHSNSTTNLIREYLSTDASRIDVLALGERQYLNLGTNRFHRTFINYLASNAKRVSVLGKEVTPAKTVSIDRSLNSIGIDEGGAYFQGANLHSFFGIEPTTAHSLVPLIGKQAPNFSVAFDRAKAEAMLNGSHPEVDLKIVRDSGTEETRYMFASKVGVQPRMKAVLTLNERMPTNMIEFKISATTQDAHDGGFTISEADFVGGFPHQVIVSKCQTGLCVTTRIRVLDLKFRPQWEGDPFAFNLPTTALVQIKSGDVIRAVQAPGGQLKNVQAYNSIAPRRYTKIVLTICFAISGLALCFLIWRANSRTTQDP